VVVSLTNTGASPGFILADGVILYRLPGQAIPPGNSEGGLPALPPAPGLPDAQGDESLDEDAMSAAYWSDELEDVASVLADDPNRSTSYDSSAEVSGHEQPMDDGADVLQLALDEWLD
jgi:hypothetical protein